MNLCLKVFWQRQTETDRGRQRQTETGRDRQRQTETEREIKRTGLNIRRPKG